MTTCTFLVLPYCGPWERSLACESSLMWLLTFALLFFRWRSVSFRHLSSYLGFFMTMYWLSAHVLSAQVWDSFLDLWSSGVAKGPCLYRIQKMSELLQSLSNTWSLTTPQCSACNLPAPAPATNLRLGMTHVLPSPKLQTVMLTSLSSEWRETLLSNQADSDLILRIATSLSSLSSPYLGANSPETWNETLQGQKCFRAEEGLGQCKAEQA